MSASDDNRDRIEPVPPGRPRDRYLPLLALADDSMAEIRKYYQTGTLYGLIRAARPVGHVLSVATDRPRVVELKSVAVAEDLQSQGLGRYLVTNVLARLRAAGFSTAVVGTSNASLDNLAFYQKLGFRMLRVERDYFSANKGYGPDCIEDGILVRDMVWLDMALDGPESPQS